MVTAEHQGRCNAAPEALGREYRAASPTKGDCAWSVGANPLLDTAAATEAKMVAKTDTKARLAEGAPMRCAARLPRAQEAVAAVSARAMLWAEAASLWPACIVGKRWRADDIPPSFEAEI